MPDALATLASIGESLNRRLGEITAILRVVRSLDGNVLQETAARMAVPSLYAQWEGFVKEAFQLYVQHVEGERLACRNVQHSLLAYAWTPKFEKLKANLSIEKQIEFAQAVTESLSSELKFSDAERAVNTRSNLKSEVFLDLALKLCLDASAFREREKKLNSLVEARNNIAHGGRSARLTSDAIEERAGLVKDLMVEVERMLREALEGGRYLRSEAA